MYAHKAAATSAGVRGWGPPTTVFQVQGRMEVFVSLLDAYGDAMLAYPVAVSIPKLREAAFIEVVNDGKGD